MKTTVTQTRAQWGKYLQEQAATIAKLHTEKATLRSLVEEAYKLNARMPGEWTKQAQRALRTIKD